MIVARSRSRYGGKCQGDDHEGPLIRKGDPIFKVPTEGNTTAQGQGPGFWVCEVCSHHYEDD